MLRKGHLPRDWQAGGTGVKTHQHRPLKRGTHSVSRANCKKCLYFVSQRKERKIHCHVLGPQQSDLTC